MDSNQSKGRRLRRWIIPIFLVALGASLLVWLRGNSASEIKVATAAEVEVTSSFTAEAYVRGREYTLSPETAGRVVALYVREGDRIKAGDLLLQVDGEDARQALLESRAARTAAELESSRAASSLKAAQVELGQKTRSGEAAVAQALAQLERARMGARPQEVKQAESRLDKANAVLSDCQKTLDRTKMLVSEGALPQASLDAAESKHAAATADVREAEEYLALLKAGPRSEDVAIAERQLDAARTDLALIMSGSAQLEPLRVQILAAKANVSRAIAMENRMREALRRTELRAPVDGVVTRLNVEKGAMVGGGAAAMVLSTREDLRIEAEIGSEDAGKIRDGMPVEVTSPAYPGRTFKGKLVSAMPVGELKPDAAIRTRIVRARVLLAEGWDLFRPGMDVDVEATVLLKRALCVPSDAIHVSDLGTGVFVVQDGRAHWRPVRVGYTSATQTEILSGLAVGDRVVVRGKEDLVDGKAVREAR